MKVGLILGTVAVLGAMGAIGIKYMQEKEKEEKEIKEKTFFEEALKEIDTVKSKSKGVMGKVSKKVNEGVGKLKEITDAWEAKENGIAEVNVPKTDFERACSEEKSVEDFEEEDINSDEIEDSDLSAVLGIILDGFNNVSDKIHNRCRKTDKEKDITDEAEGIIEDAESVITEEQEANENEYENDIVDTNIEEQGNIVENEDKIEDVAETLQEDGVNVDLQNGTEDKVEEILNDDSEYQSLEKIVDEVVAEMEETNDTIENEGEIIRPRGCIDNEIEEVDNLSEIADSVMPESDTTGDETVD